MKTLPILLKNQKILLIGGGNVALQKAQVLHQNDIEFTIISKEFKDEIFTTTNNLIKKSFKLKDIKGFYIIIDATGNKKVANKLIKYKKKNNILLNVVDNPPLCDFYFMAMTKDKNLKIAVSSSGYSPTVAQYFRDKCQDLIPNDIDKFLEEKKAQRENGIIDVKSTKQQIKELSSKVYLVGCGLGDAELLTIKAYNIIKSVDVVLYDHLISEEILNLVPNSTKKVYVGKQKNHHSFSQEHINQLIIDFAKEGFSVARLKSGDPFVFGRGAEEMKEITKHNLQVEVISGISSSISALTESNIPITARDFASGFTVVSAHLKNNRINLDWIELLNKENHTIVVLMGLSRVKEIVEEAKKYHVSHLKPCAVISNASRYNQTTKITTLEHLENDSKNMQRPAILVFGDVVNFNMGKKQ
jgi:uroporphyrin-III C-methyltransferase/precorrin-2 dehydrogenase/sirohydrochlorin ferrochelatase